VCGCVAVMWQNVFGMYTCRVFVRHRV
jgi:hypothetical protein